MSENKIDTFEGYFIKDKADSDYVRIARAFPSLTPKGDTVLENYKLIYKTKIIDGHKAFYAHDLADSLSPNPSFASNHFLFSSLIFENGKVLIAPAYRVKDLDRLKYSDFKYHIPNKVTRKDTIRILDRTKTTFLYNFRKENIIVKGRKYKRCLVLDYKVSFPEEVTYGKVWLGKKLGVVKWKRNTGRIDERIL
jgi:hypothetical protein